MLGGGSNVHKTNRSNFKQQKSTNGTKHGSKVAFEEFIPKVALYENEELK